jgi:hypothetical protein
MHRHPLGNIEDVYRRVAPLSPNFNVECKCKVFLFRSAFSSPSTLKSGELGGRTSLRMRKCFLNIQDNSTLTQVFPCMERCVASGSRCFGCGRFYFSHHRDALHADGVDGMKQAKRNFRYVLASLKLLRPVFFSRGWYASCVFMESVKFFDCTSFGLLA